MEYQEKKRNIRDYIYELIKSQRLMDTFNETIVHIESIVPMRLQEIFKEYMDREVEIIEAHVMEGKLILIGVKR